MGRLGRLVFEPTSVELFHGYVGGLVRTRIGDNKRRVKTMAQKSTAAVKLATAPTSVTTKDIMERPVLAATPLASLRDVATQLVTNEFSGMPGQPPMEGW